MVQWERTTDGIDVAEQDKTTTAESFSGQARPKVAGKMAL
jgi:hypothetical protein